MRLAHSQADVEAKLTDALLRLGVARREKLSKADFEVFADGLREFPIDVVRHVCDELGRIAPLEFQPRFPPLYILREECLKRIDATRARRQLLNAPKPEPIPDEKWQEISRQFAEAVGRKTWR